LTYAINSRRDPTHPPEGEPLIRAIAMPADANPSGDIFGGWLMSQMDHQFNLRKTMPGASQRIPAYRWCPDCFGVAG
jgi:hypothetical protein